MSGNCYSCGNGFSFFKKETGCKNCGFAFCKECISSKKVPLPNHNNDKHKVCHKCFNILTGKTKPVEKSAKYSPPEAYKKRVAALDGNSSKNGQNIQTPGSSGNTCSNAAQSQKQYPSSMSREDITIAERLDKLKAARRPDPATLPNQQEIEARLGRLKGAEGPALPGAADLAARAAKLQGNDPSAAAAKQSNTKTGRGDVDDLLNQVMEEVELDAKTEDEFKAIEDRLNRLKGKDPGSSQTSAGNIHPDATSQSNVSGFAYQSDDAESGRTEDEDTSELQQLIGKIAKELEMDAEKAIRDLMKDKAIAERLAQVKENPTNKKKHGEESSGPGEGDMDTNDTAETMDHEDEEEEDEDEEEAVKRIIQQALEEQKLDEAAESSALGFKPTQEDWDRVDARPKIMPTGLGPPPGKPAADEFEEELPWCCICNEDATLRCHGCDDDLYCRACYKEGHDRYDMEDHTTEVYKHKPRNS